MTQKIVIPFAENSPLKPIKQLSPVKLWRINHIRIVTYLWHQSENNRQCSGRGCLWKLEGLLRKKIISIFFLTYPNVIIGKTLLLLRNGRIGHTEDCT